MYITCTDSVHTMYLQVFPVYMQCIHITYKYMYIHVYAVMWLLMSSILGCCLQDTILVIPPYPYCIEEVPQDVPLEDCWYDRPQLYTIY